MQPPNSNYYNYHKKPIFKKKLSVVQNEAARQCQTCNHLYDLNSTPCLCLHRAEGGNSLHIVLHIMAHV